jgi:hypothetical protein
MHVVRDTIQELIPPIDTYMSNFRQDLEISSVCYRHLIIDRNIS